MKLKRYLYLFLFSFSFCLFTFKTYTDVVLFEGVDNIIEINFELPKKVPEFDFGKEDNNEEREYISVKNSSVFKNDNYRATLKIDNTSFEEPIYQYSDNDYYLTHDGLGRKKSSGATYLDYRVDSSSDKILIYGHNNDSLSLPFSVLENYNYKEYYEKHRYLVLEYDEKTLKYELFSVYIETNNWDYMKINFDKEEWEEHLNNLKNRSIYDTGVSVDSNDKILILQTCSKNKKYSSYKKKYMLVIGKLIEE